MREGDVLEGLSRIGYGAAKLTGPGIWGDPTDRGEALAILRMAVELGVNFFDMADSYGPFVVEELVASALHPYRDLTLATKAGCLRTGPDQWTTFCRPDYLRQCCEMSLRRLRTETIDLFYLHAVDRSIPLEEQVGVLRELREEGKIRHIGLSSVDLGDIEAAQAVASISAVQNEYNVLERQSDAVVEHCAAEGILFVPFFPLGDGALASPNGPLSRLAAAEGCTPAQLAIAWLLRRPGRVLPIPGASSLAHVRENVQAAQVEVTSATMRALDLLQVAC